MPLCGSSFCGCAVTSVPADFAEFDGAFPTIDVAGNGTGASPWNLTLNDEWSGAVVDSITALQATVGDLDGDLAPYAPTLTNITIGNGTQTHQWKSLGGGFVLVSNLITFGTTTSFSGWPLVAPPAALDTSVGLIGFFAAADVAPGNNHGGSVATNSSTQVGGFTFGASGIFAFANATSPFTWATGDIYRLTYIAKLA